jgi:ABC-type ATPase with predicted acetyltransferase domain
MKTDNNKVAVWECECGTFEYGKFPPEECNDCGIGNSFIEVPEDKLEEIEGDIEDNLIKKVRTKEFEELGAEEEDED